MTVPDLLNLQALLDTYDVGLTMSGLFALGFIILALLLFAVASYRVGGPYRLNLRPIAAFDFIRHVVIEAAESGHGMHLSVGTGSVGSTASAETLAGVNAARVVAGRAATAGVPFVMTTASPVALPLLQSAGEQAYAAAGAAEDYRASSVRFAGDDRTAYAVTATDVLQHEDITTSVMIGALGDETLFIGERAAANGIMQITGTASTRALPYAVVTANHTLVGEEIYAAGAYLSGRPVQQASLLTQDWLRVVVVAIIILGVVVKTLGL
jgi:hypothetical protein